MDPRALAVVTITLLAAAATGSLPLPGDPGPGQDAGDDPGNATRLPGPGTYNGTLHPPGDADWYRMETSPHQALCSQAVVQGNVHAEVTLTVTEGLYPGVTRPVEPGLTLDLGLSTPSTTQILLGLEQPQQTSPVPATLGFYQFDLRTLEPGDSDGDADTGQDAGDEPSTAVPTEGPCIGGTIEAATDSDVYAFDGVQDDRVALSLTDATSAPVLVNLTSPSGQQVAQVEAGGFTEVTLEETGEWFLRADVPGQQAVENADYVIGVTVNGPEPRPCKPGCTTYGG